MKEAAAKKKVLELNDYITVSHIGKVAKAVGQEGVYLPEKGSEKSSLEESLDLLGLHVKYLMFDLEATRRENKYLRALLESRPSDGEDTDL